MLDKRHVGLATSRAFRDQAAEHAKSRDAVPDEGARKTRLVATRFSAAIAAGGPGETAGIFACLTSFQGLKSAAQSQGKHVATPSCCTGQPPARLITRARQFSVCRAGGQC